MITNTRDRVIEYIVSNRQARVDDLVKFLGLSHVAIHKQLRWLIDNGILQKAGKPPLVFYTLIPKSDVYESQQPHFPKDILDAIEANFLSITPDGRLLYGVEGFIYWANLYQKNKPLLSLAQNYKKIIEEKKRYVMPDGWIDATIKLTSTFKESYVDRLLYQDVYSYPIFGRTKLAKLVMHAKQSESKSLIDQIAAIVKPVIEKIIKKYDIDAIGFIPPTVPRPLQFMDEFQANLNLPLSKIDIVKVMAGEIPIPQKTLAKLEERILNARSSMYLRHTREPSYANVLLIDDVAGSGASFNETASKLKGVRIGHNRIIAFATVGNIKGYDVIRQI